MKHLYIFFGCNRFFLRNKENIPIQIKANTPHASDKIAEINRIHLTAEYLIICNEKIISRQIHSF